MLGVGRVLSGLRWLDNAVGVLQFGWPTVVVVAGDGRRAMLECCAMGIRGRQPRYGRGGESYIGWDVA